MDEDLYDSDSEEVEHDSDSDSEEENVEIVFGNFQRDSDLDTTPVIPIKLIKPVIDGSSVKIGEITCFLVTFNSSAATPKLCQWSFPSTAMAAMDHYLPTKCKNGDEDFFSNTEEEEAIPDLPPSRNSAVTHRRRYRDQILRAERRAIFVRHRDAPRQTYKEAAAKRSQILSSSFVIVEAASKTAKKPELAIDLHSSGSGGYKNEFDLDAICFAPVNRSSISTAISDYIVFNPGGNRRHSPSLTVAHHHISEFLFSEFLLLPFSFSSPDVVVAPPSFESCIAVFDPGGALTTVHKSVIRRLRNSDMSLASQWLAPSQSAFITIFTATALSPKTSFLSSVATLGQRKVRVWNHGLQSQNEVDFLT